MRLTIILAIQIATFIALARVSERLQAVEKGTALSLGEAHRMNCLLLVGTLATCHDAGSAR